VLLIFAECVAKEGNFRPLRSHQQDSTSDTVYAEGLITSILEDGGPSNLKVVIARNEKYGAPHIEREYLAALLFRYIIIIRHEPRFVLPRKDRLMVRDKGAQNSTHKMNCIFNLHVQAAV
jgi:hypothetical protein